MATLRCLRCGRFAPKKNNFCSCCGTGLKPDGQIAVAVDKAFDETTLEFLDEMDFIDATEIVSVVRRADDEMLIDFGDLDSDTAISLLAKGLLMSILRDLGMRDDEFEEEDEDEE